MLGDMNRPQMAFSVPPGSRGGEWPSGTVVARKSSQPGPLRVDRINPPTRDQKTGHRARAAWHVDAALAL